VQHLKRQTIDGAISSYKIVGMQILGKGVMSDALVEGRLWVGCFGCCGDGWVWAAGWTEVP
jgi:hypothetical protein